MWGSIQEQEERDYQMGAASELQNAYAWSIMNRKPDDSGKINAALEAGKHVIIEEGTEYCPSTDAIMGSRKYLIGEYESREAAEAAMHKKYDGQDDHDGDISVYILPHPSRPAYVPPTDEEIPF